MNKERLENVFKRPFKETRENYKALCPFHDERTPSFYVHRFDNIAHCFGCGISGSTDTLASKYLGISEADARRALEITPEETFRSSRERRDRPKERFISESWLAPFQKGIHKYVIHRGLHRSVLEKADSRYDRALKRQVFPHRDRQGHLLGVAGRACYGQEPKWLFYWDYDKGAALYALNRTTQTNNLERLILVEGIFDVLLLLQSGYTEVAATLGTSITARQIQEIKSSAKEVVLAFDNDDPGRNAVERGYRALRKTVDCRFVTWPAFANDWMDLSKEQIDYMLSNTLNYVQRSIISHTEGSSRVLSEQKESCTSLGAGDREDNNFNSNSREVIRVR